MHVPRAHETLLAADYVPGGAGLGDPGVTDCCLLASFESAIYRVIGNIAYPLRG